MKTVPSFETLYGMYVDRELTLKQTAVELGVEEKLVSKWLRQLSIPRRNRGRPMPSRQDLEAIWDSSHTTNQICLLLKISMSTLYRLLDRYELPLKPRVDQRGPNSPSWKGGCVDYYGPNWDQQRSLAIKRDNGQCRRCGLSEVEMGHAPDVHHLRKLRLFKGDYEAGNALTNLVTLCPPCHSLMEDDPSVHLPAQADPSLRSPSYKRKKSSWVQPILVDPAIVVAKYREGLTIETIARELQIGVVTIYRSLERAGVQHNRKKEVDKVAVQDLIAQGISRKEVAIRLGISLPTVYRVVPIDPMPTSLPETRQRALELAKAGKGTRIIAKTLGVGRSWVQRVLRT